MAELVDALGSGSSGRRPVGVRVPPSAPQELQEVSSFQTNLFFLSKRAFGNAFGSACREMKSSKIRQALVKVRLVTVCAQPGLV